MRVIIVSFLAGAACYGQLSEGQKVEEFQGLAGLYARRYAPANWKIVAYGQNIFDIRPWLTRVRASKSDLEFLQICSEYVHALRDGHSTYRALSTWSADLGLATDIFDGKVLIEAIDRFAYPRADFPFEVGDELVSIDGRPVAAIMDELSKNLAMGSPRALRRLAADYLIFRPQSIFPLAPVTIPDKSTVVIRRAATGGDETFQLTWFKDGYPLTQTQPIPNLLTKFDTELDSADPMALLNSWQNLTWTPPAERRRTFGDDEGNETSPQTILGWGVRTPYYRLPAGFRVRRGAAAADWLFSGTYEAEGKRIGLIRIPSYSVANTINAIRELQAEVTFMRANTDGLVVDDTRNPGGSCNLLTDVASILIPFPHFVTPHQLTANQVEIQRTANSLANARFFRSPQWVIDSYQYVLDALVAAAKENRALTGPLGLCSKIDSPYFPAPNADDNQPWRDADGRVAAYEKPMIVLADELSVSGGDLLPAIIQDNRRAPIVGYRTGGLGGYVENFTGGVYTESTTRVTRSMMVRRQAVKAPELPAAPYVENIGVLPDIELDYMTRENLITGGAPFVQGFTRLIVAEIMKAQP